MILEWWKIALLVVAAILFFWGVSELKWGNEV